MAKVLCKRDGEEISIKDRVVTIYDKIAYIHDYKGYSIEPNLVTSIGLISFDDIKHKCEKINKHDIKTGDMLMLDTLVDGVVYGNISCMSEHRDISGIRKVLRIGPTGNVKVNGSRLWFSTDMFLYKCGV